MDRNGAFLICVMFLAVALSPMLTASGGPGSRAELTTFKDGSTSKTLAFNGAGQDTTVSFLIEKTALVSKAQLSVSWESVTNESVLAHTKTADFSTGNPNHANLTADEVKLAIEKVHIYLKDPRINQTGATSNPLGVAVGDIDGDGLTDIVVALTGANSIGIFYQNSANDFDPIVNIPVGTLPNGVAVGDVNNDGLDDIVVANQGSANITVVHQDGAGGLNATQNYATAAGCNPRAVAIGDLNNDSRNDVAVACGATQTIEVFRQAANGNLQLPFTPFATTGNGRGIDIADMNNDGLADAVVATQRQQTGVFYGYLNVLNQTIAGSLSPSTVYPLVGPGADVRAGDLDNDGKNDVAVSSDTIVNLGGGIFQVTGRLELFYQQNNGGLGQKVAKTTQTGGGGVDAGDVSSDGLNDVVQADGVPPGIVVASPPASNLGVYYQDNTNKIANEVNLSARNRIADVRIGDLDDDGDNDVVATYFANNTIGIYEQVQENIFYLLGSLASATVPANGDIKGFNATWNVTLGNNGTMVLDVSNNGGSSWVTAQNKTYLQFPGQGNQLKYRVSLGTNNNTTTPVLDDLTIRYKVLRNPANPALNIGNTGQNDWSKTGNFTGTEALTDFSVKLNTFISQAKADAKGMVTVPIMVVTSNAGKATLSGLRITYTTNTAPTAPVLSAPTDGAWANATPTFTLSSTDVDTNDTLRYTILVSNDNFTTVYQEYNQTVTSSGWTGAPYHGGGLASFVPGTALADGRYKWMAKAFDGQAWSPSSQTMSFSVDTHPPAGTVTDDGDRQADHAKLHAIFHFTDNLGGVTAYQYSIGTSVGLGDVLPSKDTIASEVTETGLLLKDGTYYFTVRAKDAAGLWGQNASSDGITVYTEGTGGNAIPSVLISDPVDGATVSGPVTVRGKAMDLDVSDMLKAFVRIDDGNWSEASGGRDWTLPWDTTKYTNAEHTVSARAHDGKDDSSLVSIKVKVNNPHNLVIRSYEPASDSTVTETGAVNFSVVAVDNLLHQMTYTWTVDGKAQSGTSSAFKYVPGYNDSGSHKLKVVVKGPDGTCGLSAEHEWTVTVLNKNRAPTGLIEQPTNGAGLKTGTNVKFKASGIDPDGQSVTFRWDFGDGQKTDGPEASHKYSKKGPYTVTLTVTDGSASFNTTISVTVSKTESLNSGLGAFLLPLIIIVVIVAVLVVLFIAMKRRKKAVPETSPPAQPAQAPPVVQATPVSPPPPWTPPATTQAPPSPPQQPQEQAATAPQPIAQPTTTPPSSPTAQPPPPSTPSGPRLVPPPTPPSQATPQPTSKPKLPPPLPPPPPRRT
jgi:hypothetical protein